MSSEAPQPLRLHRKLPRLRPEAYQGRAAVFWTHTLEDRARGWLDERFHARFRDVLLHACARHALLCPAYVLMPDHWHLIWLGEEEGAASDQRLATRFLRRYIASALGAARLQEQAFDRVLREEERRRGAFESTIHYLRENPVRAGLVQDWRAWPFGGVMVPGYPDLAPQDEELWGTFWRIYTRTVDGAANLVSHETGHAKKTGPEADPP